jgi:hypothetical protein
MFTLRHGERAARSGVFTKCRGDGFAQQTSQHGNARLRLEERGAQRGREAAVRCGNAVALLRRARARRERAAVHRQQRRRGAQAIERVLACVRLRSRRLAARRHAEHELRTAF